MKFSWLSVAAIGAIVQTTSFAALAADLPVKAATAAPSATAYSWTGCYVGINGGYGWNNGNTNYNDPNSTPDPIDFIPGGIPFGYIATPGGTGSSGAMGGAGAGCNWQNQKWVFGIEGDFDGAKISGNNAESTTNSGLARFGVSPTFASGLGSIGTATEQVSLRWLSTVRGRLGFAIQDRIMLFGTGGLAIGSVKTQGSVSLANAGLLDQTWAGSSSVVKVGGVLGAGVEWATDDHLTVKAEYLWYDLGNVSHPLNCAFDAGAAGCTAATDYLTLGNANSSVFGSIVRVGLNYKFN